MRFVKPFLAFGLLTTAPAALASSTTSAVPYAISVLPSGVVLFNSNGSRSARPGCATIPLRWAFDGATPAGQAKLAVILSANAQNKTVTVTGTNTCSVHLDTESMDMLFTDN